MALFGYSRRGVLPLALLTALAFLPVSGLVPGGFAPSAYAGTCDAGPNPTPPGGVPASDHMPGYSRTAADVAKPISVDEVLARAVDWEEASPKYCQADTRYPDRHGKAYRADCSGFVSMAWHTDMAYATGNIAPAVKSISWSEVQPGDALITDGHIELVWSVEGDMIETIGFGSTPVNHMGPFPAFAWAMGPPGDGRPYKPIRYKKIELITDEMIREAIAENVPKDAPIVQPPDGRTMVNWPTLFSSNVPSTWRETVELGIGTQVELEAKPVHFLWDFGDGNTKQSDHPGVGYQEPGYEVPANRIVHPYQSADSFEASVDTTWSGYRYRVIGDDGTPEEWQDVDGEHVADGESTELDVLSMQSVLVGNDDK